jgi:hypothetical protein
LLLWGGLFALTVVLVWPAVWANPLRVVALFRESVQAEGLQPHPWGNFFLGRAVETPDLRFYPLALALRSTPLSLVGLLLLPWAWRWSALSDAARRDLLALLVFTLLFVLAMSLFPKKFNRYVVPVFPTLDVLAAVGLWQWRMENAEWRMQNAEGRMGLSAGKWRGALLALIGVLAVGNAAWWHPYHIAAYNQLLGGAPMGARTFVAGWGEGLGQAAAWLNQQPDITGVKVASTMGNTFQPYLRHGAQAISSAQPELPDQTGYVLVYIRSVQRGMLWSPFDQFYPARTPLYTVRIHGVEYAWVYQVPPPVAQTSSASFVTPSGATVDLRGYTLETGSISATGMLTLTVQWQSSTPLEQDYMLFAHLLDSGGQRMAQTDAPPAGPDNPTSAWQSGRVYTWRHPLPVRGDLPPGDYWLALGLYDPADFARLPLAGYALPPDAPDVGGDALLLPVSLKK